MIRLEFKEDRTMAKPKPIVSITLISILSIAISPSIFQSSSPQKDDHCCVPVLLAPIVVSGANIYTAWTNATILGNDVPVFFTKSNDGGKTFANTIVISTANKNPNTVVINQNISIGSSGNNVAVTWWTNRTGIFNPVIRISNDGGNTFTNIIRLNSTSGGTNER